MKMHFFVLVCAMMGSWASSLDEEPLSLIQRSMIRRALHDQKDMVDDVNMDDDEEQSGLVDDALDANMDDEEQSDLEDDATNVDDAEEDDFTESEDEDSGSGGQLCEQPPACVMNLKKMSRNRLHVKYGTMVYSQVCVVKGQSVDLVVGAFPGYRPIKKRSSKYNGLRGAFGRIGMRGAGKATFKFSFVKSGTTEPMTLDSVVFTFYDLEGSANGQRRERLYIRNYASYSLHVNSRVHRRINKAGTAVFTAEKKGTAPNPKRPNKLTTRQQQYSVEVRYESVSEFTVTYAIVGGGNKGSRQMFFAGLSALKQDCAATPCNQKHDCSLTFQKVVQNNLGGVGPDSGAAELRYESICSVSGNDIDLVITANTAYKANNAANNGVSGVYGNINLLGGTKSDLKFQFVKKGTSEAVAVETMDLTMFDMDGKHGVQEKVVATGYDTYTLGENSTVLQQVLSTTPASTLFSSTEIGYANERPTDPMKLTPLQARRTFSVKYLSTSSFVLGFEITGRYADGGRNFVFAGHSSINWNQCTSSLTDP